MSTEKRVVRTKGADFVSFAIGKTILTMKVSEVHAAVLNQVIVHGLNAKIGDKFASAKDLTDAEIVDGISDVIKNLKSGIFNATGGGSGSSILAEAIARVRKVEVAVAKALVDKLDDEQLKNVSSNASIKKAIADIKAERAAAVAKASADSSKELDELLDGLK